MPVQPMKSIAAVAITPGNILTIPQIMAAGITTSAVLAGLGLTGLMTLVNCLIPLAVVRGIQVSQGLAFAIAAVKYMLYNQDFAKGKTLGDRAWLGLDGKVLAIVALCFVILVSGSGEGAVTKDRVHIEAYEGEAEDEEEARKRSRKGWMRIFMIPTALIVLLLGIVLAFVRDPSIGRRLRVGPSTPQVVHISRRDWRVGFVRGAIPQLPLSVLNSVIAVVKLSNDLFPTKTAVTPVRVSVSSLPTLPPFCFELLRRASWCLIWEVDMHQ